jgi:hypothetical protein
MHDATYMHDAIYMHGAISYVHGARHILKGLVSTSVTN